MMGPLVRSQLGTSMSYRWQGAVGALAAPAHTWSRLRAAAISAQSPRHGAGEPVGKRPRCPAPGGSIGTTLPTPQIVTTLQLFFLDSP